MPGYCCVPWCTERSGGHQFPKDDEMKLKWKVAIRRINPETKKIWEPGNRAVVCRKHFTSDCYQQTLMGKYNDYMELFKNTVNHDIVLL